MRIKINVSLPLQASPLVLPENAVAMAKNRGMIPVRAPLVRLRITRRGLDSSPPGGSVRIGVGSPAGARGESRHSISVRSAYSPLMERVFSSLLPFKGQGSQSSARLYATSTTSSPASAEHLFSLQNGVLQPRETHSATRSFGGVSDFEMKPQPKRLFQDGGESWILNRGEHWVVTGPNGAGKSVILGTLTGDTLVPQGRVLLNPAISVEFVSFERQKNAVLEEIRRQKFLEWAGKGDSVIRRWSVKGRMEAAEKVGRERNPLCHFSAKELIIRTGLSGQVNAGVHSLSTGELRKVVLSCGILRHPDILLLDEPFDGLDAASRDVFERLFHEIATLQVDRRPTIVMVTHRESEIPAFVSRRLHVEGGRVQEVGVGLNTHRTQRSTKLRQREQGTRNDEVVVSVHGVNVAFPGSDRPLLQDFEISIARGDKLWLRGPNGSGKSTLCRLIAGKDPRSSGGAVYFHNGIDAQEDISYYEHALHTAHARLPKGVPVSHVIFGGIHNTVGWSPHSPRPTSDDVEACRSSARVLGLESRFMDPFNTLSQGQKQRALLARALVRNPALLILDEPLHGFDALGRLEIATALDRICTESPDLALLFVSHYMDEVPASINRVVDLE